MVRCITDFVLYGLALWCLAAPHSAAAYTCVAGPGEIAWPTLEEAAAASDAVFIARVTKQVMLAEPRPYENHDVAYIEVTVIDGIAGIAKGAHLRVWDAGFGSSCSVDLRPLHAGILVALAVERSGDKYREYYDVMKLTVAPDDYLVQACGDYQRLLRSQEEAEAVATSLQAAVRASRRTRE